VRWPRGRHSGVGVGLHSRTAGPDHPAWGSVPEDPPETRLRRLAGGLPELGIPSRPSSPLGTRGDGIPLHHGAPSPTAKRENRRAAYVEASAPLPATAASHLRPKRISICNPGGLPLEAAEQHEEVWNESISTVETMLHGFKERALEDTPEERAARALALKGQQEAQRRKEMEQDRAEKGSRLARNPRAQIAWRLELKRQEEFEAEGPSDENVPMHKAVIPGRKERFDLVDIHAVRLKCRQLEAGVSVSALLEQQRVEERIASQAPFANLSMSKSLPSLFSQGSGLSTELSGQDLSGWSSSADPTSFHDRYQRANARKQASRLDKMLRRLHSMRGDPSEEELARLNCLAQEVARQGDLAVEQKVSELCQEHPARQSFLKGCAMHQELPIPSQIAVSQDVAPPSSRVPLAENSEHKKRMLRISSRMKLLLLHRAKQRRAMKRWALLRGVVRTFCVYVKHAQRTKAIHTLKRFLHDLTESITWRRAMKRVTRSIKLLTSKSKEFVQFRRQRIAHMHEMWQQVENRRLVEYFELFARAAAEDGGRRQAARDEGRRALSKKVQAKNDFLKEVVLSKFGWQKLRIPEKERTAIIERFYSAQLRRQCRTKKTLYNIAQAALSQARWLKDVQRFLEAPVTQVIDRDRLGTPTSEQKPWWEMGEETALDLIAFAVSGLKEAEPFARHPSVAGLQTICSPMVRRRPSKGAELLSDSKFDGEGQGRGKKEEEALDARRHRRSPRISVFSTEGLDSTLELSLALPHDDVISLG